MIKPVFCRAPRPNPARRPRTCGMTCRVCLGFRVQGSVFRAQGLGFRVQGAGFRI